MPMKAWGVALGCAALCVVASVSAAVDPTALKIDQDLQGLKEETIHLNRDLEDLEQGMLFPDQSMTTIYVAIKVSGFLIDNLSIRINENEAVTHTYSDSESVALLKDEGWQRL